MSLPSSPSPELLAPAGDWEALRAAVAHGADAVYFGLPHFNARHRATNFTLEELPQVLEYLHQRHVRGYVAFNTLIFSDELPEATRMIHALADAGADAVIVQDLGLARLIRQLAPSLPVHASTQMTLTEPHGIELVRQLGIERVILARELSLSDIERIAQRTDMPLEVFVHGALCVAYSGQCLTSEALGGRSANRGQCAQACRLPYEMIVDGQPLDLGDRAYLLSPQDLAAHSLIDQLVRLGVCSFKIEGRLKSAEYVAITTQTYRAALTAAIQGQSFALSRQGQLDLAQSFSRGLTPGFLQGVNHQLLVQGRFPKNRGVEVGIVAGKTRHGVLVDLTAPDDISLIIKPGDGVVFDEGHPEQDEQGGRVYQVQLLSSETATECGKSTGQKRRRVELRFGQGTIQLAAVVVGSKVWKTDDPALHKRLAKTYQHDLPCQRIPLTVHVHGRVGQALQVTVRIPNEQEIQIAWPGPLERARKHPFTMDIVRDQLGRLGDTPFILGEVTADVSDAVMVPKSVLNDLRRQAVALLLKRRASAAHHPIQDPLALDHMRGKISRLPAAPGESQLYVLVRTLEQLDAVLAWQPAEPLRRPALVYCDFEDGRRYREAVTRARAAGVPIGLATLRIIKPGEDGLLRQVAEYGANVLLVRNLAGLMLFREQFPSTKLIGDFSLNVANELTADWLVQQGLARLVPSYDLNWEQLTTMVEHGDPNVFEVVTHQHMPMFHMEHCVFAAFLSTGKDWRDCGRPCDRHRVELRDRMDAAFPVVADAGCRNTVFNAVAQSAAEFLPRMQALGLRHFRIELLRETADEVGPLLTRYTRVLAGLDDSRSTWRQLQVIHQLGVTRGTLQMI